MVYLAGVRVGPLRGVAGEPCSGLLLSWTRCRYRGLWLIQRCSASHASRWTPLLVKLTASAMRAARLLGRSSRHLQQVRVRVRGQGSKPSLIFETDLCRDTMAAGSFSFSA